MSRTYLRLGRRRVPLPTWRPLRIAIGSILVVGGILGFLPVLGFWMIPLGVLVLSADVPTVRRWRRRFEVRWLGRRRRRGRESGAAVPPAGDLRGGS